MNPLQGYVEYVAAVFIFLGSIVFYISTLISGHNIYKDFSFSIAILVSGIVGFGLFVFSPIAYLIFTPDVYIPDLQYLSSVTEQIRAFHKIVVDVTLPYLLAALGLGIIVGCLTTIQARSLVLRKLREKTDLQLTIQSYESAWDFLLKRVKRQGLVCVLFKNDHRLEGRLAAFSTKEEPTQIILENCRAIDHDDEKQHSVVETNQDGNRTLVANANEILEIHVPNKSFKPKDDPVTPPGAALYLATAALGSLLIVISTYLTSTFTFDHGFVELSKMFCWLSLPFIALACVGLIFASLASAREYTKLKACLVLSPSICLLIISGFVATIIISAQVVIWLFFRLIVPMPHVAGLILIIILIIFLLSTVHRRRKEIDDILKEKLSRAKGIGRQLIINEMLDHVYLETDFNKPHTSKEFNALKESFLVNNPNIAASKDEREIVESLFGDIAAAAEPCNPGQKNYLEGQEFNIAFRYRWLIHRL